MEPATTPRNEKASAKQQNIQTILTALPDDVVLTIFSKVETDPRNWARISCVCTRFASLIRHVCYPYKCSESIPTVASDLISSRSSATCPPSGININNNNNNNNNNNWASLYKLAVCCPGLLHSGVLLEHSDFGLDREVVVGPHGLGLIQPHHFPSSSSSSAQVQGQGSEGNPERTPLSVPGSDSSTWSLYDDLYFDTVYNASETLEIPEEPENWNICTNPSGQFTVNKRRKIRSLRSHLASGIWNLSREQGNKLLASRFRDDCLYICDWPGCIHIEEKRNYMLFRGVFKNFKKSRVWRTINDGNRSRIDLNCAFCTCKQTWDLHSAFCLRRVFGYHDDGEPVVRAYVCENGHVSGAWTDWPLYT